MSRNLLQIRAKPGQSEGRVDNRHIERWWNGPIKSTHSWLRRRLSHNPEQVHHTSKTKTHTMPKNVPLKLRVCFANRIETLFASPPPSREFNRSSWVQTPWYVICFHLVIGLRPTCLLMNRYLLCMSNPEISKVETFFFFFAHRFENHPLVKKKPPLLLD